TCSACPATTRRGCGWAVPPRPTPPPWRPATRSWWTGWPTGHAEPASDGAAGHRGRGAGVGAGTGLAGEVLLDAEPAIVRALGDGHQRVHVRDLLDLLAQEPQHELLAQRIGLGTRRLEQRLDLPGDLLLLLKRERQGGDGAVELDLGGGHG